MWSKDKLLLSSQCFLLNYFLSDSSEKAPHYLTSKDLAILRRCVWPRCCTVFDNGAHPDHFRQKMFSFKPRSTQINQSNIGHFIVPLVREVCWYIITTKWPWLCSWQPKICRKRLKKRGKMAQKWQFLCHRGHFNALCNITIDID